MGTYKPKVGDILLVHSKGFVPKGIRFFTKCYYNHAAIIVRSMGELCVLEAIGRGFMITKTYEEYKKETCREYAVLRAKDVVQPIAINERLINIIGHPYDYKSLLYSQIIKQISSKDTWKGAKDIKATKKIYCSEAIAYAYPTIFPKWWSIAPVDIYNSDKLENVYKTNG